MRDPELPGAALLDQLPLVPKLLLVIGLCMCGWIGVALAVAWLIAIMR